MLSNPTTIGMLHSLTFAPDYGVFIDVHALRNHWFHHSQCSTHVCHPVVVRTRFKHRMQPVQGVTNFVQGHGLVDQQISVFVQCVFFVEIAYIIPAVHEVIVLCGLQHRHHYIVPVLLAHIKELSHYKNSKLNPMNTQNSGSL